MPFLDIEELHTCKLNNGDHNLLVIRSQKVSDENQTRSFWSATQLLCQHCFKIIDMADIEKEHYNND